MVTPAAVEAMQELYLRDERKLRITSAGETRAARVPQKEHEAANRDHLAILHQGVDEWNAWREKQPGIMPDLTGADLANAKLAVVDFRGCYLSGARLVGATLVGAYFDGSRMVGTKLGGALLADASFVDADLTSADLMNADISRARLNGACLVRANLTAARFDMACLDGADLKDAWLIMASLVRSSLLGTDLTGCNVYGCSVWDSKISSDTKQSNLIITFPGQATITVDNVEVAQFIYTLLNNDSVRDMIDTITSKVVLILGRFTPERKTILDALRAELRKRNYLPLLFDFDAPASRDLTETISLLARMARFVIADLTDAKSLPQELAIIVPDLPSVPVQPLLHTTERAYGMFEHWQRYPWVLPICRYDVLEELIASLGQTVIAPSEQKALELRKLTQPQRGT
jgi:hypothetical protein